MRMSEFMFLSVYTYIFGREQKAFLTLVKTQQ